MSPVLVQFWCGRRFGGWYLASSYGRVGALRRRWSRFCARVCPGQRASLRLGAPRSCQLAAAAGSWWAPWVLSAC